MNVERQSQHSFHRVNHSFQHLDRLILLLLLLFRLILPLVRLFPLLLEMDDLGRFQNPSEKASVTSVIMPIGLLRHMDMVDLAPCHFNLHHPLLVHPARECPRTVSPVVVLSVNKPYHQVGVAYA